MLGGMEFFSSTSVRWWVREFSVLVSDLEVIFNVEMLNATIAGSILRALDSVGLTMLYWVFGAIIAAGKYPLLPYNHL
jgi:hypothetical protein